VLTKEKQKIKTQTTTHHIKAEPTDETLQSVLHKYKNSKERDFLKAKADMELEFKQS